MTLPALPITLRASRRKWLLVLSISLAFVAIGVWVAPENPVMAWSCVAFFGLCALVAGVNLHPNSSYLVLDTNGFTFSSLFRKHSVRWSEVQEFFPIRVSATRMVGWNFTPQYAAAPGLRKVSTALSGAEAALPDTYGKSVEELAELLECFRSRYGSAQR